MILNWDDGNLNKILKRFTLTEIEDFFHQELFVIRDDHHSQHEHRFIAVGIGPNSKPMFLCFTIRGRKFRVISARYMRAKEVRKYESFKKNY